MLGWNFHVSLIVSAVIVLVYIFLGGLTSAIYNEVLQFFLIVLGFLPLVFLGLEGRRRLERPGGEARQGRRRPALRAPARGPTRGSTWRSPSDNPMGVEWFGMVMGLGFVLSFGYWCTDFLVVQRAMAANSMSAARRTPLIAAVPKMLFPALVIMPGMIAMVAMPRADDPDSDHAAGVSVFSVAPAHGIIPPKLEKDADGIERPVIDPRPASPCPITTWPRR